MDKIDLIQLGINGLLAIITGIYAYYTKKLLDIAVKQMKLSSNPIIGFDVKEGFISEMFGPNRRNLSMDIKIVNIGNDPAIDVLIDSEICLEYSNIKGEKKIPARFEPSGVPFLRAGEECNENSVHPSFGNTLITHLFDDFREHHRLNIHRIEVDPSQEAYKSAKMILYVYYHNNLDQYFKGSYEFHIYIENIPKDDEFGKLNIIYIPRPMFYTHPISKEEMDLEINDRNKKRNLCGW